MQIYIDKPHAVFHNRSMKNGYEIKFNQAERRYEVYCHGAFMGGYFNRSEAEAHVYRESRPIGKARASSRVEKAYEQIARGWN